MGDASSRVSGGGVEVHRPGRDALTPPHRAQELIRLASVVLDTRAGKLPMSRSMRYRVARLALRVSKRTEEPLDLLDHVNTVLEAGVDASEDWRTKKAENVDGALPIRPFISSDCLTADVPLDFCALWLSQILDPELGATWRVRVPSEVLALANATPRTKRRGVLLQLYGRGKDLKSRFEGIVRTTGFSLERVVGLSHYGYNHGWIENIIKGRVEDAKEVAEDALFLLFAELSTADTRVESEWCTGELKERAVLRLLQHACGVAATDPRAVVLSGALVATRADRQASIRGETAAPDLTQYFWLRYVDSGASLIHARVSARASLHRPVDLRELVARDGTLANDLNDTVVDATGTGINYVLVAYANRRPCAGTHVGLILRGSLVTSIRHATITGDLQPLVANVMVHGIHLWGPRYSTAAILENMELSNRPGSNCYVVDTSWPPRIDCDPEIHDGYLSILLDYVAIADLCRGQNGQEAYYKLLDAAESGAERYEVERHIRACVHWLAVAAEQCQDMLAWGAISDLSVGITIDPGPSPSSSRLHTVRQRYEHFK